MSCCHARQKLGAVSLAILAIVGAGLMVLFHFGFFEPDPATLPHATLDLTADQQKDLQALEQQREQLKKERPVTGS